MPASRDRMYLIKAARMYFLDGRSQDDIARVLGTSRSDVARTLTAARAQGIEIPVSRSPYSRVRRRRRRDRFVRVRQLLGSALYRLVRSMLKIVTIVMHAHVVAFVGGVSCAIWPKNQR